MVMALKTKQKKNPLNCSNKFPHGFALSDLPCTVSMSTWDSIPGHCRKPCLRSAAQAASSRIAQPVEVLFTLQGSCQMPLPPHLPIQNKLLWPVAPRALYFSFFGTLSVPDTLPCVGGGHTLAIPQTALRESGPCPAAQNPPPMAYACSRCSLTAYWISRHMNTCTHEHMVFSNIWVS